MVEVRIMDNCFTAVIRVLINKERMLTWGAAILDVDDALGEVEA